MEKLDPAKANRFGFIPRRLEVEERPELADMPLNILFVSFANIDGVDTSAQAVYWPQYDTFKETEKVKFMRYLNQFSAKDRVDLWFFKQSGWYEGDKFVANEHASRSVGQDWQAFFMHLTSIGLTRGEGCEFKSLNQEVPSE
jgi:hypothetical protein